jgi:carboxypeptidase T
VVLFKGLARTCCPTPMTPRRARPHSSRLAPLAAPLVAALLLLSGPAVGRVLAQAPPATRAMYRIPAVQLKRIEPLLGLGLDIAGRGPQGSLDLILTPAELERVRALGYEPVAIDVTPRNVHGAPASPALSPNLGDYHTVAETRAEMTAYVAAYPSIARLDSIGTSVEGRSILAVEISDNVGQAEGEPEVLIAGCHHARELMSVEVPLYVMRRLLQGYGSDPVITDLVNTRDIWIVPIVNPDGHVYVENHSGGQSDTWWRKNRRVNGDGSIGVDLNRNYGYQWGYDDIGSSSTPSSEVFRGTGPFSEPETAAMRDFMAARAFTTSASFHSYGDLLLYPWGYAQLDTPDRAVFRAMGDSISLQNGYLAGNPKSGAIYLTNGEMCDWEYGETGLKPRLFGFTFEVNTSQEGGFAPNDALIGPTCDLNWGPVLTLLRYADAPRRIVGPARPGPPTFVQLPSGVDMQWTYPAPDPVNPPVRHEIRRADQFDQGADDAEGGPAAWDTVQVSWSTARSVSGTHSYHTGDANNELATLTARAAVDVAPGDSLVVWAWWDMDIALRPVWLQRGERRHRHERRDLPPDHVRALVVRRPGAAPAIPVRHGPVRARGGSVPGRHRSGGDGVGHHVRRHAERRLLVHLRSDSVRNELVPGAGRGSRGSSGTLGTEIPLRPRRERGRSRGAPAAHGPPGPEHSEPVQSVDRGAVRRGSRRGDVPPRRLQCFGEARRMSRARREPVWRAGARRPLERRGRFGPPRGQRRLSVPPRDGARQDDPQGGPPSLISNGENEIDTVTRWRVRSRVCNRRRVDVRPPLRVAFSRIAAVGIIWPGAG